MEREGEYRDERPVGRQQNAHRLLRAIQDVVADDALHGVGLKHCLGANIWDLWRCGALTDVAPNALKAAARVAVRLSGAERFRTGFLPVNGAATVAGRIAVEVFSDEPRIRGFWAPIVERLGPERCVLVLTQSGLDAAVPAGFESVRVDLLRIDWSECRRWVLSRWWRWRNGLLKVCTDFDLAPHAHWLLADILIAQVRRLATANAFAALRPNAFLSIFDKSHVAAPLCSALRAEGVPTYTLVHGAVGRQSMPFFVPLIAEKVLVWGPAQARMFSRAGVEPWRIKVVGCQRTCVGSLSTCGSARHILQKKGLTSTGPVIVIAFTMLSPSDRDTWIAAVRALVRSLPEAAFVCRLHPSDNVSAYSTLISAGPRLCVVEPQQLTLDETLCLADLIVVDTSTFGFDALVQGKHVAVLDPYSVAPYQAAMLEVLEAGAALYSRDPVELASLIRQVWRDSSVRGMLEARSRAFVNEYIAAYSDEAATNVVQCMLTESQSEEHSRI